MVTVLTAVTDDLQLEARLMIGSYTNGNVSGESPLVTVMTSERSGEHNGGDGMKQQ